MLDFGQVLGRYQPATFLHQAALKSVFSNPFTKYRNCDTSSQRHCDDQSNHSCDMKSETIGKRVVRIRKLKGWNQATLVRESKLPQSTVGSIENDSRTKESSALIDIAHALGVDAYYLKTGKGSIPDVLLTTDERKIVEAFRLFGAEMKMSWLMLAEAKLAEQESVKNIAA